MAELCFNLDERNIAFLLNLSYEYRIKLAPVPESVVIHFENEE